MLYQPRNTPIEVALFEIGGRQFAVTLVDDKPIIMHPDILHALFVPAKLPTTSEKIAAFERQETEKALQNYAAKEASEKAASRRAAETSKPKADRFAKPMAGAPTAGDKRIAVGDPNAEETSTGAALMRAITEQRRTRAETIDRVCILRGWDVRDEKARGRVAAAITNGVDAGRIAKRTDPNTQLPYLEVIAQ